MYGGFACGVLYLVFVLFRTPEWFQFFKGLKGFVLAHGAMLDIAGLKCRT